MAGERRDWGYSGAYDDIRRSARRREKVDIVYMRKTGGTHKGPAGIKVYRTISPYEVQGRYLYATDEQHGPHKIHSFILNRIASTLRTGESYRPVWPVRF
jgi:hypothetical protein